MNELALTPSRTVLTSFSPRKPSVPNDGLSMFADGDWVLRLTASSSLSWSAGTNHATLACALSNGDIQVYDQQRLHRVNTFRVNNEVNPPTIVTDLTYADDLAPHSVLIAGSQDGGLSVFDVRQQPGSTTATAAARIQLPTGQAPLSLSVGFQGTVVAVGSNKARVHFYDLRQMTCQQQPPVTDGALLGSYVDVHTDEVSCVSFRHHSSVLLSASEDGLAVLYDTTQPTEAQAVQSVINAGAPVRKAGFCGPDESQLFCLTGNESVSVWNWHDATCRWQFGRDLRDQLQCSMGNAMAVDYLVDARYNAITQELCLVAGSATGDAALLALSSGHDRFVPRQWWRHGHRGVVRGWVPLSPHVHVTAGEDAHLCEWDVRRRRADYNETALLLRQQAAAAADDDDLGQVDRANTNKRMSSWDDAVPMPPTKLRGSPPSLLSVTSSTVGDTSMT